MVVQNGLSGVIDAKGAVVIPFEFDWIEGFAQPVSRVRKGARMGVVSPFGDMLLAVEHDHVGVFNNGLALVVDGTKCGYVDQQGGLAIPMRGGFCKGRAQRRYRRDKGATGQMQAHKLHQHLVGVCSAVESTSTCAGIF